MITLINPRNQQGLRYLFDLVDPQSNPESIDMGTIQPVIDLNFGGYSKINDYSQLRGAQLNDVSIAGVNNFQSRILSYGNIVGGDPQIVVPLSHCGIVWGIKTHVTFDAAGATAFSGKYFNLAIKLRCPDVFGTDVDKYWAEWQVTSGVRLYGPGAGRSMPISREHLCIIPLGCALEMSYWVQDGSNWPANTKMTYHIVTQCFPAGASLPVGI